MAGDMLVRVTLDAENLFKIYARWGVNKPYMVDLK
jgi:hypothetical protein